MAVAGKCLRDGCPFAFEDADHLEDAIDKCAAHFRMEHPTKGFARHRYVEQLEIYNLTLDEAVALYAGNGWRELLANGGIQPRNVIHACTRICRYPDQYPRALVEGAAALSAEHGQAIPDPFANARGNGQNNDVLDFIENAIDVEFDDGIVEV